MRLERIEVGFDSRSLTAYIGLERDPHSYPGLRGFLKGLPWISGTAIYILKWFLRCQQNYQTVTRYCGEGESRLMCCWVSLTSSESQPVISRSQLIPALHFHKAVEAGKLDCPQENIFRLHFRTCLKLTYTLLFFLLHKTQTQRLRSTAASACAT